MNEIAFIESLFGRKKGIRSIYDLVDTRLTAGRAGLLDRLAYLTTPPSLASRQGTADDAAYPTASTEFAYLKAIYQILKGQDQSAPERPSYRTVYVPGDGNRWVNADNDAVPFFSTVRPGVGEGFPRVAGFFGFPNYASTVNRTQRSFTFGQRYEPGRPVLELNTTFEYPWLNWTSGTVWCLGVANVKPENMGDSSARGVWIGVQRAWTNPDGQFQLVIKIAGGTLNGSPYTYQQTVNLPFLSYGYPYGFTVSWNNYRIGLWESGPRYSEAVDGAAAPPTWPWAYEWPWPYSYPNPFGNRVFTSEATPGYIPPGPSAVYPMLAYGSTAAQIAVEEVPEPIRKPTGPAGQVFDLGLYNVE